MKKQNRILRYQKAYLTDYGFESVMVASRQKLILDILSQIKPFTVVEIGCGTDLLYEKAAVKNLNIKKWIIVEPSKKFFNIAKKAKLGSTELHIINAFLEDAIQKIKKKCIELPDCIICSGVLHEVPNPKKILSAIRSLLKHKGTLHVNVPNANSFHRRLAKEMGLIKDEKELSERNKILSQYRVFDMASLKELIQESGFEIETSGGYFIKPFTHNQMESIKNILSNEVLNGLWKLGQKLPEIASEIYFNATVKY